jgi:3-methyladenine DNA glycosylase AlkD
MPTNDRTPSVAAQARAALALLERKSSTRVRDSLPRSGIIAPKAMGVAMGNVQAIAKQLGRNHALAEALWKSGWYEARCLTAFVDDPAQVTPAQMDRWCADFDNWGICDTICFHLFDRTPHAYRKVAAWKDKRGEFQKRAAFALLASLAGHDKKAPDAAFLEGLRFIEAAATDDRNFVKKAVNWALRRIGTRNAALRAAAIDVAARLSASSDRTARWVGADALRQLQKTKPRAKTTKTKK